MAAEPAAALMAAGVRAMRMTVVGPVRRLDLSSGPAVNCMIVRAWRRGFLRIKIVRSSGVVAVHGMTFLRSWKRPLTLPGPFAAQI